MYCNHCLLEEENLLCGAGCGKTYCSEGCAQMDWDNGHEEVCEGILDKLKASYKKGKEKKKEKDVKRNEYKRQRDELQKKISKVRGDLATMEDELEELNKRISGKGFIGKARDKIGRFKR